MSSYFDSSLGFIQQNPKTSGGMIFFMILCFILSLTLSLVWSDFIWGWGILRKRYPGEKCQIDVQNNESNCLSGLKCGSDGLCGC